ncbi:MAG: hypothetical protein ACI4E1_11960 [Lachnospira sp.]
MKKIALLFSVIAILCLAACGKKVEKEDEVIFEPEYLLKEYETTVSDNGLTIVNGYYMSVSTFPKCTLFFPVIDDKKNGIYYIDDQFVKNSHLYNELESFSKPDGTYILRGTDNYNSSFGMNIYSGNIIPEFARQYYESHIPDWNHEYEPSLAFSYSGNDDMSTSDSMVDTDVGAFSVALYEDFYGYSPTLTVSIYGVPNSLLKDKFGSKFGHKEFFALHDKMIEDGLKAYDYLCEKKIDKTDVYYIDFTELNKKGEYANYVVTYEMEGLGEYYSFYIYRTGGYNISNQGEFDKWKKEHSGQMIN